MFNKKRFLKFVFWVVILTFFSISCNTHHNSSQKERLQSFTILPDGSKIIFSWVEDRGQIYQANINGSNPQLLVKAIGNMSFFNPNTSPSGTKIVFIGRQEGSVNSSIWQVNLDGFKLKQVTDSLDIKTEAIFSPTEDSIFFCKANSYQKYSPVGRRAAHDFDIYSLSLSTGKIDRMTKLAAYGLYHISNLSKNEIIFSSTSSEHEGIFILKRYSNLPMRPISPLNKGDRELISYSTPSVIDSNRIVCDSYYELLTIDLNENKEKVILRSPAGQFERICFDKKSQRLYFTTTSKPKSFFSVKLDGSDLIEIPLKI